MLHVPLSCPHCLTEQVSFKGDQFMPCGNGTSDSIILLQCGYCGNGVVGRLNTRETHNYLNSSGGSQYPRLLGLWPKIEKAHAPSYLTPHIESYYSQGLECLKRRAFDAAGTMFRKALEASLKRINLEGSGSLYNRINELSLETGITSSMKQWAHEIRDLGNDAAHEEEPFTEHQAKELHSFTEMFLTYAFTLPGMLQARRAAETPI